MLRDAATSKKWLVRQSNDIHSTCLLVKHHATLYVGQQSTVPSRVYTAVIYLIERCPQGRLKYM